MKQKVYAH